MYWLFLDIDFCIQTWILRFFLYIITDIKAVIMQVGGAVMLDEETVSGQFDDADEEEG